MRSANLSKSFWIVFGTFNLFAVLYLFMNVDQPETDDARITAAAMLVGALLVLGILDVIAVAVAGSFGSKQRLVRQN